MKLKNGKYFEFLRINNSTNYCKFIFKITDLESILNLSRRRKDLRIMKQKKCEDRGLSDLKFVLNNAKKIISNKEFSL